MPRNTRPLRYVRQFELDPNYTQAKYFYQKFSRAYPVILQNGTQAAPVAIPTFPTAAQDNVASITFPGADNVIEMYSTTAQTLVPLPHATKGLSIALDQVDNESVEYVPGGNSARSNLAFVVGTDSNFFVKATFEIEDSDGMDQFGVGFRKQENYVVPTSFLNGGAAGYTDFAMLGFAAAVTNPNQIRSTTSVGSAVNVATATSFTVADAGIVSLEVRVIGGKPKYLINGYQLGDTVRKDGAGASITAQPTISSANYTFTNALTLIPFIFVRQDAAISLVFLRDLEVGHLTDVGLDPNAL